MIVQPNDQGSSSGPMYYLSDGLKSRWLAGTYALVAAQLALTALALPVWLRRTARASLSRAEASNERTASEDARP